MKFSDDIVEISSSLKSLEDRVALAKRNVVSTYTGYPEEVPYRSVRSGETRSFPIEDDMPGRTDSTITWNPDVMCMMFASDESVLPCTIYTKYNTDDMEWNGKSTIEVTKKAAGW